LLSFEFRFPQAEAVKPSGTYRGLALSAVSPVPGITFERVLDRLQHVPGVISAATTSRPPLNGLGVSMRFSVQGRASSPTAASGDNAPGPDQVASYFAVSANFFGTMKTRILQGREFNTRDTAASSPVVIINRTMARRFFQSEDPVGKQITLDWVPEERPREIIGVVGDTVLTRLQRDQVPIMYVPFTQQAAHWPAPNWFDRARMYFVLRTSGDPLSLVPAAKLALADIDQNRPAINFKSVEQSLDQQVQYQYLRFYVLLLGVFGGAALFLAVIGLYGVMAYAVSQRTREIGVRVALGADSSSVVGMVLHHGLKLVALGILLGLTGALALTGMVKAFLFGVSSTDPLTYAEASFSLVVVAIAACVIPVRRALRVDPTHRFAL